MDRLFIETKVLADEAGSISGLAWKFAEADRVGDMIAPGAFKKAALPLPMLFGHDMNDPVGAWTEATEKADGLHIAGKLLVDDLPRAREVAALVKAGAVRGISLGFISRKSAARPGGGRTITDLELLEASLVAVPMHPAARVTSAKSAIEAIAIASAITRAAAHMKRN